MATTNITITSSDTNNNSVQKTITGINPDATSAQLVSTAQKIVALTDNTYVKTDRVDKTNCDTEASGDMKQTPTFTLVPMEISASTSLNQGYTVNAILTSNSDGAISFGDFSVEEPGVNITKKETGLMLTSQQQNAVPCTFKVMTAETETYKAASVTVTITA